jgi:C4-dicarboxylate transporter DctM subunit
MMLLLLFLVMLAFIALGMEIAFAMGLSSLIYIVATHFLDYPINFNVMPIQMIDGVNSFTLIAIPLFVLAGEIMNKGGITVRLVRFSESLVGHFRGGLGHTSVVVNMILAGMSGSAVADAAATGSILIPAMKEDKYPPAFAAAIIASASTMGPVIPPSISLILIGAISGTSIGRLFLAGVIPGIAMGLSLMVYIYLVANRRGWPRKPKATLGKRVVELWNTLIPLGLPFIILGGIISGVTTPTEAAVLGVIYATLISTLLYKTVSLRAFYEVVIEAGISSMVVVLTISTAILFGWLATAEELGPKLIKLIFVLTTNKYMIVMIINIILLIMGCVMEGIPIILLMTPILFPVAKSIGMDPVQFGMMINLNIMIGLLTPPIGLNLFITSVIAKEPIEALLPYIWPMVIALLCVLVLVGIFPPLCLWLPNLLMGKG